MWHRLRRSRQNYAGKVGPVIENATLNVDTLWPLLQRGTPTIPPRGHTVWQSRGRFIVEPARR